MEIQQQPSVVALSPHSGSGLSMMGIAQREWPLLGSVATAAAFLVFGKVWLADLSIRSGLRSSSSGYSVWCCSRRAHCADVGRDPSEIMTTRLGTLVLTLSVAGIEIMMIAAIMYTAEGGSSLARDTMFAAVMIVMNGMIGLSLLLGGLRYHEQTYNLQGANAFLAVIVPLAVLSLILPTFTTSSPVRPSRRFKPCFTSSCQSGCTVYFWLSRTYAIATISCRLTQRTPQPDRHTERVMALSSTLCGITRSSC
jgi:hypothetical protein